CAEYGFPSNPACIAYDAVLDLLAIATKEGSLYVYGKPGVFLQSQLKSHAEIIRVYFLSGSFKLLVLTGTDDLHLFEISKDSSAKLEEKESIENIAVHMSEEGATESDFGLITALTVTNDLVSVLIGNELGSLLVINFDTFKDSTSYERIENRRISRKYVPVVHSLISARITGKIGERIKSPVVAILDRPGHRNHILIGFSSGSCVIYDRQNRCSVVLLPGLQGLKSVCWCGGSGYPSKPEMTVATPPSDLGNRLLASFSDGSLGTWKLDNLSIPSPADQPLAGFQDKNTVSLLRGSNIDRATMAQMATAHRLAVESAEGDDSDAFSGMMNMSASLPPVHVFDSAAPERVCFDLPSKLVHLCAIGPAHGPYKALLLLCEEELIAVDLISPDWPSITLPYLNCLHTSTIKTHSLVTGVKSQLLHQLEQSNHSPASHSSWPIHGGDCLASNSQQQLTDDLLLLGHEDGSVAFWRLGKSGHMQCIYRLHTTRIFHGDFGPFDASQETDSWPPFRRIGLFDPYMDEYRGLVTCLRLVGETLLVGGAAGQVTVWQLMQRAPRHLPLHQLTLKKELVGSKWRGNEALTLKQTPTHQDKPGLHPLCVIQVQPPCRITSLCGAEIPSKNGSSIPNILVALGTPLGFGMVNVSTLDFDNSDSAVVFRTCTLPQNPEALNEASVGDGWARRRTRDLKKSLRDSFRRLKRMRSTVNRAPVQMPINRVASTNRSRVGLQSGATQSKSMMQGSMLGPGGSTVVYDEVAPNLNDLARGIAASGESVMLPPTGVEREITDRPSDTMETAVIRTCTFSPVHFRSRTDVAGVCIGSVLFGTAGGVVRSCSIYANEAAQGRGYEIHVQPAKELIIQHKAPVLNLRILEPRSASPLPNSVLDCPWHRPLAKSASSLITDSSSQPLLLVWTEEQVRAYSLPSFSLKHKIRITAKDGSKIQTGSVVAFPASSGHLKN
ncbi:inorganic pyrophosphatase, partial [Cichlidogyrus casuarinus]